MVKMFTSSAGDSGFQSWLIHISDWNTWTPTFVSKLFGWKGSPWTNFLFYPKIVHAKTFYLFSVCQSKTKCSHFFLIMYNSTPCTQRLLFFIPRTTGFLSFSIQDPVKENCYMLLSSTKHVFSLSFYPKTIFANILFCFNSRSYA